jgi:ABC-type antimicrobial peptide transport system ATPase subunit
LRRGNIARRSKGEGLSEDTILETRGLTKEFKGFVAVKDVSLKVRRGSIHALIGPNGAGKTTCFNLLTHFLTPTRGQIFYKGREITGSSPSRIARMGAICDVYDAVTSNRVYKRAWDPAESIAQMASWKGHFDPDQLKSFIRAVGIYPTGSLVRLQSGKLAVVLEGSYAKFLRGLSTKPVHEHFGAQADLLLDSALELIDGGA